MGAGRPGGDCRGWPAIGPGCSTVRRVVEHAPDLGIGTMTLYAFSSENWRRPAPEVEHIFWLLRSYLRLETERAPAARRAAGGDWAARSFAEATGARDRAGRIRHGSRCALPPAGGDRLLVARCDHAGGVAGDCDPLADPGASAELLGRKLTEALTEASGEVDLLIRTGGEKRLSDFLLWESAYAELLFTDRMWPEFDENDLEAAIAEFGRRQRRFGGIPDSVTNSERQATIVPCKGPAETNPTTPLKLKAGLNAASNEWTIGGTR